VTVKKSISTTFEQKNTMRGIFIAFLVSLSYLLVGQNVGIGTNTPHNSAALQIEDTNRGLLIPRMSSAERVAISNPAEGLLLYDYNLKSVMLYKNGAWFSLLDPTVLPTQSMLKDDDSDTSIDVEANPDEDKVRFVVAGNERMVLTQKSLEVKSPGFGVHIGEFAGEMDDGTNNSNVFVGNNAGRLNTTGQENVAIGRRAGQLMNSGNANVYLGFNAGKSDTSGSHNVFIGHKAGEDVQHGAYNVFIGSGVGYEAEVDSQLRIHHKTSEFPLIQGDFGTRDLTINGDLMVADTLFANNGSVLMGETNINNAYSLPQNLGFFNQVLKVGFGGNLIWSADAVNDADNDPTNEIETWSSLSGIPIGFSDNIDNVIDADADPSNELQTLSLSGDILSISGGNTVDLSSTGGSGGTYIQDIDGTNSAKVATSAGTISAISMEYDGQAKYSFREDYVEFINGENNTFISQVPLSTSVVNAVTLGKLAGPTDNGVSIGSFANQLGSSSQYATIAIGDSSVFNGGSFNIGIGKNALVGDANAFPGAYESIGIGFEAGMNSTGDGNIFMGHQAGLKVGSGRKNIGIGESMAGLFASNSVASTGQYNIGVGFLTLDNLKSGEYNLALGSNALFKLTDGDQNIGLGQFSLYDVTVGNRNIAIGRSAGRGIELGEDNIAIGDSTMIVAKNTKFNVAVGKKALNIVRMSTRNTAIGTYALENYGCFNNETPFIGANTAVGYGAMQEASASCTGGGAKFNVAMGNAALRHVGGQNNVGIGYLAGFNSTQSDNVYIGSEAGYSMDINSESVIIGSQAAKDAIGYYSGAIAIGYQAGKSEIESNTIAIGHAALSIGGAGANSVFLGASTFSTLGYDNQMALGYNANATAANQVRIGNASVSSIGGYANWTNVSDQRFKKNIKEDVFGLNFITGLRPVTYELDRQAIANFNGQDHTVTEDGMRHSGFIAQEVEDLAAQIGYEFSGISKPQNAMDHYGLKYAEFVVPLVQSVKELKELLEEKQNKIDMLEERLTALEARANK
jgi:hypothetical protein